MLTGGFSRYHDLFFRAGLQGLGYNVDLVPMPTKADYQAGREYGNNGQCSPAHFTVGALVNYLKHLRDEKGIPTEKILRDYVFMTMGACGPCRFGMYEAEYRLALRNSGFDGFRVISFQMKGGLDQIDGARPGFEFDLNFFLTLGVLIILGDLINEIVCQIRPYEMQPGQTDRVFEKIRAKIETYLREIDLRSIRGGALARMLAPAVPVDGPDQLAKFFHVLRHDELQRVLGHCARLIDEEIEVDYTRPKPLAKMTGEFWVCLTEGDGSFNLFRFLESQGAELIREPITTWINFLLAQGKLYARDARGLASASVPDRLRRLKARAGEEVSYGKKWLALTLLEWVVHRVYEQVRGALGGTAQQQVDQRELQQIGHPFYNCRSQGGEGHMEVSKAIYYSTRNLAHMVLSLKPFGCLPSTQSDGAQAAALSRYPEMIFLPIETSGEGDLNAFSRVQMALSEAKELCGEEFRACVEKTGFTLEQIRSYVAEHPELRRPLQRIPREQAVTGRAANFVLHVGRRMRADRQRGTRA
ncbi:MAG: activator of (R)-2-hydroxyglutaryl-CoA dehydratase [Acidobacteriota bacterium]|nr:MAG: activator of (R)-2-hydroxyglutaryl-CoA dehydratase [Acidobacteriota bacterium]